MREVHRKSDEFHQDSVEPGSRLRHHRASLCQEERFNLNPSRVNFISWISIHSSIDSNFEFDSGFRTEFFNKFSVSTTWTDKRTWPISRCHSHSLVPGVVLMLLAPEFYLITKADDFFHHEYSNFEEIFALTVVNNLRIYIRRVKQNFLNKFQQYFPFWTSPGPK